MIAVLLEHFHGLDLEKIARLTDKQLYLLYLHKRDRHGAIDIPIDPVSMERREQTLEGDLADLDKLAKLLHLKPEKIAELQGKLREKHSGRD